MPFLEILPERDLQKRVQKLARKKKYSGGGLGLLAFYGSRIGLDANAIIVNQEYDFFSEIKKLASSTIHCILIDEAQFLKAKQINQLSRVADSLNIPVMCYGIRTDFRGELFEGSASLLALADNLIELKTVCSECPRKATMVVRLNESGKVVTEGSQVQLGGNDIYKVVCRKHFRELTNLI